MVFGFPSLGRNSEVLGTCPALNINGSTFNFLLFRCRMSDEDVAMCATPGNLMGRSTDAQLTDKDAPV